MQRFRYRHVSRQHESYAPQPQRRVQQGVRDLPDDSTVFFSPATATPDTATLTRPTQTNARKLEFIVLAPNNHIFERFCETPARARHAGFDRLYADTQPTTRFGVAEFPENCQQQRLF